MQGCHIVEKLNAGQSACMPLCINEVCKIDKFLKSDFFYINACFLRGKYCNVARMGMFSKIALSPMISGSGNLSTELQFISATSK
jgi:hypothetical protein